MNKMTNNIRLIILLIIVLLIRNLACEANDNPGWSISILPASIRLDPSTNEIIEQRFNGLKGNVPQRNLLNKIGSLMGKRLAYMKLGGNIFLFN